LNNLREWDVLFFRENFLSFYPLALSQQKSRKVQNQDSHPERLRSFSLVYYLNTSVFFLNNKQKKILFIRKRLSGLDKQIHFYYLRPSKKWGNIHKSVMIFLLYSWKLGNFWNLDITVIFPFSWEFSVLQILHFLNFCP